LLLAALAVLGTLLVFGVEDDLAYFEEPDDSLPRAVDWRVVGIAFAVGALASATFIAASAFVDYLDRITA